MPSMGKQRVHRRLDSDSEDFESGFVLPKGSLNFHLSKDGTSRAGSRLQQRPHTSQSDVSASTSTSGGSIIFSTSSESTSESEDQHDTLASLGMRLEQHAAAQTQTQATTSPQYTASAAEPDDSSDNIDGEDDEKSSTLKATQLPADFAEQLALSKVQAASAKEASSSRSTIAVTSARDMERTTACESEEQDDDFESGFDIPMSTSKLSLVQAPRPSLWKEPIIRSNSPAAERPASRSSSSWSLRSSMHKRSDTSHSHASSSARKTESSEDVPTDESFFEGLELPSYLARGVPAYNTPPSSVDSSTSKKANLQAVLKEKLQARARLFEPSAQAAVTSSSQGYQGRASVASRRKSTMDKFVEAQDEAFEDAFMFKDDLPLAAHRTSHRTLPILPSSISLKAMPNSQSFERHSPLPTSSSLSSRSSSTRSNATLRPTRSSLHLMHDSAHAAPVVDTALSRNNSIDGQSISRISGANGLRSRPSLSNLSGIASSSSSARPQTLLRKASANALADAARAFAASVDHGRPSSSLAHYAQPTRASLARHQLPFATLGRSGTNSRPSTPAPLAFPSIGSDSKSALTSSPSSSNLNTFSRLTRPTIASSAKSHKPTGSDPSGRTSASLGMPIPSAPSSPLKTMSLVRGDSKTGLYRQPRRMQTFGDGSELDGFDDLPVNREVEKKFVKIPLRRRQSSGVASVDSNPSTIGSQRNQAITRQSHQSVRKERTESTAEFVRKQQNDGSGSISMRAKRSDIPAGKFAGSGNQTAVSSKNGKRPALKLIRNLSATGLSQVQGQMKWNPVLLKWEGNEASLVDFDNVIASSARPALISPLGPLSPFNVYSKSPLASVLPGGTEQQFDSSISQRLLSVSNPHGTTPSLGGVRVVGDMIFDPVKRSWFSMSNEGEEELNFGDDEDDRLLQNGKGKEQPVDAWAGGEEMRLRTRKSFANDRSSNASSHGGMEEENWNFDEFSRVQKEADKRHNAEMKAWKTANGPYNVNQRQHLNDIKQLVNM